jgi:mono/diheme cytochrome c family protein
MRYIFLVFLLSVVAVVAIAGFRGSKSRRPPIELIADMDRQPKLRPETASTFFKDGRTSRLPVEGTIARATPMKVGETEVYAWQVTPVTTGRQAGTTNFLATNPLPVNEQFMAKGEHLFNIYCAACHTKVGDGNSVAKRINAMGVVANLHDKRIVELTDGEFFNTISVGKNLMSGYADKLDAEERWAVVAYVRALQLTRLGGVADVPESARATFAR